MSSTKIPWIFPLTQTELGPEESEAVQSVLNSGWLSMGPATEEFETAFARFLGAEHAVAVSNGTAALHLAFLSTGIGPGDEVLCPSLSFVATANAVVYTGATPVFVDIAGSHDVNMSTEDVIEKITPRTRAIAAMHFGGFPCDVAALRSLATERGLVFIEDSAHALGSVVGTKTCGTWGDLGCFSFFPNKNMTTGEGGMVVTDDADKALTLRQLRSHGMTSMTWDRHRGLQQNYAVTRLGFNYRTDEIRSALGLAQLRKLPGFNEKRRRLATYYMEHLLPLDEITVPFTGRIDTSCCHLLSIVLRSGHCRRTFRSELTNKGIQTSVHYPAIHTNPYYSRLNPFCRLPETESIAERVVTLPLYPSLTTEGVDTIVAGVKAALRVARSETQVFSRVNPA